MWIEPLNRQADDASSGVTELLVTVRHYHKGNRSFHPVFTEKDCECTGKHPDSLLNSLAGTLEYLIKKIPPSTATKAGRDEALKRRDAIGHPPLDHSSPSRGVRSLRRRRPRHSSFIAHLRRLSRDGRRYTEERAKAQSEIKMWDSST